MASKKAYHCPACQNEVDRAAPICSNPVCRKELAFCSHCLDVATYALAEKGQGRLARDRYKCDRCQRVGVKCVTWMAGGYCNGLARAGQRIDSPLCANCNGHVSDVGKSVVGYLLIGAVGGLFGRKK